jgi:hypothetical protein
MGALIINVTRRGFALRKCAQSPAIAAQKSIRARAPEHADSRWSLTTETSVGVRVRHVADCFRERASSTEVRVSLGINSWRVRRSTTVLVQAS